MLESISIQNYRNLTLHTDLDPELNLIIASNGRGKTNFLESIYYTILGESFRPVNKSEELFEDYNQTLKIILSFDDDKLEIIQDANHRKFVLNGKKIFLSKIPSKFPVILFAPQSVDLVSREPGIRRQDLNHFLSIIDKNYKESLSKYTKIIKNRNSMIKMIKDNRASRDNLKFWTDKLVETGFEIFKARIKFFEEIKSEMRNTINLLGDFLEDDSFKTLEVEYISFIPDLTVENFLETMNKKFLENMEKEIIVGKTLYGVHKDDFQVLLRGMNLRYLGSRGQQRIGILLFKLAEAFFINKIYGKMPLILLDDLMSELDNTNREKLSTILNRISESTDGKTQIIMTTADGNEIPQSIKSNAKILNIFNP